MAAGWNVSRYVPLVVTGGGDRHVPAWFARWFRGPPEREPVTVPPRARAKSNVS